MVPPDPPNLSLERALAAEYGIAWVAGADEAGRGALAGPIFAAAVLIPINEDRYLQLLHGVHDSKLLSPRVRELLFDKIISLAAGYGIATATAEQIDRDGIISATRQAMTSAILRLEPAADAVLVDGPLRLAAVNVPQKPVVRGDRLSLSIAAASILAKVSRDRYMVGLGNLHPEYGFSRHKGYGTAEHLRALGRFGPCPEHRRSFAPLRHRLF